MRVSFKGLEDFDIRVIHPEDWPHGWIVVLHGTNIRFHQHAMTMKKYAIAAAQEVLDARPLAEVRSALHGWNRANHIEA